MAEWVWRETVSKKRLWTASRGGGNVAHAAGPAVRACIVKDYVGDRPFKRFVYEPFVYWVMGAGADRKLAEVTMNAEDPTLLGAQQRAEELYAWCEATLPR